MRTRMYGGVRGRKTKVGGKPTFVFLLLDYKVKGLTGENPSVFFKRYKLNRAAQLIKERKHNIYEIADMTGFSTLSHFSTSFKKQFGVSPSEYIK